MVVLVNQTPGFRKVSSEMCKWCYRCYAHIFLFSLFIVHLLKPCSVSSVGRCVKTHFNPCLVVHNFTVLIIVLFIVIYSLGIVIRKVTTLASMLLSASPSFSHFLGRCDALLFCRLWLAFSSYNLSPGWILSILMSYILVVKGDSNTYLISISLLCHFCSSVLKFTGFSPREKLLLKVRSTFEPLILSKVRLAVIHPVCQFLYVSINILSVLKIKRKS